MPLERACGEPEARRHRVAMVGAGFGGLFAAEGIGRLSNTVVEEPASYLAPATEPDAEEAWAR